jgi:hypothetical protein
MYYWRWQLNFLCGFVQHGTYLAARLAHRAHMHEFVDPHTHTRVGYGSSKNALRTKQDRLLQKTAPPSLIPTVQRWSGTDRGHVAATNLCVKRQGVHN